ncbi:2Fe-2S iron-sulfur cluster protein [Azospirillum brasilense]|uniref:2Fe-2S iron-sulfur cluster protein n=1 Tax=Azospirillum brasilense TaxID=192 RepID=A0A560BBV4_AZOBR|nr:MULTISPECIES: (2Fe-2S)-binding protein [Azospirillum]MBB3264978.1 putative molibdopterin-dependent oxidoreductase YjgC [Azospirillum sp. OGB3]TWA69969.1 2Fe-2S iron-sulfur cluster protein [Azospirillum brasilense]
MFQRLPDAGGERVSFTIDGRPAEALSGDSVAAALLANGVGACRTTPVSGAPRGPYCMMGVCFDCLVTIDGTGNQQGCQIRVRPGMRVETQNGKREIER